MKITDFNIEIKSIIEKIDVTKEIVIKKIDKIDKAIQMIDELNSYFKSEKLKPYTWQPMSMKSSLLDDFALQEEGVKSIIKDIETLQSKVRKICFYKDENAHDKEEWSNFYSAVALLDEYLDVEESGYLSSKEFISAFDELKNELQKLI